MKKDLCGIIISMLIISLFPLSVGSADLRAHGYGDTRAEAEQNARVALLQSIRVDVESTFVSLSSDTGDGLSYSISDKTKQTSSGTLLYAEIESSTQLADRSWSATSVIREDKIALYEYESDRIIALIDEIEVQIPTLGSIEEMKGARLQQLELYEQWNLVDVVLMGLKDFDLKGKNSPSVSLVEIQSEYRGLLLEDTATLQRELKENQNQDWSVATQIATEAILSKLEANRLAQEQLERANQEERQRAKAMLDAVLVEKYSQMMASLAKHTTDWEAKRVAYEDVEDYVEALEDVRSRIWRLTLLEDSDLREVLNLHDAVIRKERDRILNEPYDALLEVGRDGKPVASAVARRNSKVASGIVELLDRSNEAVREAMAVRNAAFGTIVREYNTEMSRFRNKQFTNDSKSDIYGLLEIGRYDPVKECWPIAYSSKILFESFSLSGEISYDDVGSYGLQERRNWKKSPEYNAELNLLDAFFKSPDSLVLEYGYTLSWDPITNRYIIKDFTVSVVRMDTKEVVFYKRNVLYLGIGSTIPALSVSGHGSGLTVADAASAAISNLVSRFPGAGKLSQQYYYTVSTETKDGYITATCSLPDGAVDYSRLFISQPTAYL